MSRSEKPYYAAYEERYRAVHARGLQWSSREPTPVVMETVRSLGLSRDARILEIGCGEGRDARAVLAAGFDLLATDLSPEAVAYCRGIMPESAAHFAVLDVLNGGLDGGFDLIYAVAVIHMLVRDEDRDGFYRFIRRHLAPGGHALICSMGDGVAEMQSDVNEAFELREREHVSGKMLLPATSCRMVSFPVFRAELARAGLAVQREGLTASPPDFDRMMFALVTAD